MSYRHDLKPQLGPHRSHAVQLAHAKRTTRGARRRRGNAASMNLPRSSLCPWPWSSASRETANSLSELKSGQPQRVAGGRAPVIRRTGTTASSTGEESCPVWSRKRCLQAKQTCPTITLNIYRSLRTSGGFANRDYGHVYALDPAVFVTGSYGSMVAPYPIVAVAPSACVTAPFRSPASAKTVRLAPARN